MLRIFGTLFIKQLNAMGRLLKQLFKQVNQRILKDDLFNKKSNGLAYPQLKSDSVAQSLEALEARIMLDAAGVATTADVLADQVAADQTNKAINTDQTNTPPVVQQQKEALREAISSTPSFSRSSEIVFIDSSVDGYEELLTGIHASAEVILLSSDQDGVEQIANALSGRSNIDAIHIISHGESGQLTLGNTILTE